MAEFMHSQRRAFMDSQPKRLRNRYPEAFDRAFMNLTASLPFVEQIVADATEGGISDRYNMEILLDSCLMADWLTPDARAEAGIEAILRDNAMAGVEKVTTIANAAAFAIASSVVTK